MNRQALLAAFFGFFAVFPVFSQDANQAALLAERREAEERYTRLANSLEDLRDAYAAQTRRIQQLAQENAELRQELNRQVAAVDTRVRNNLAAAATREDLKTLTEKLKEVDEKREADKKLILKAMKDLEHVVANTPAPQPQVIIKEVPVPSQGSRSNRPDIAPPADGKSASTTPALDNPNGYWKYSVQKGDTFLAIMQAYNAKLKEEGKPTLTLDQLKAANPTVNPNALRVNQEIMIPIPGAK